MKVTLERIVCDVCEKDGERYTLSFPEGTKVLDRCEKHSKKILALREEAGDWIPMTPQRKTGITVVTVDDIAARRDVHKRS